MDYNEYFEESDYQFFRQSLEDYPQIDQDPKDNSYKKEQKEALIKVYNSGRLKGEINVVGNFIWWESDSYDLHNWHGRLYVFCRNEIGSKLIQRVIIAMHKVRLTRWVVNRWCKVTYDMNVKASCGTII